MICLLMSEEWGSLPHVAEEGQVLSPAKGPLGLGLQLVHDAPSPSACRVLFMIQQHRLLIPHPTLSHLHLPH